LSQNVVHSDSDLILHNSSVLIDKEPENGFPVSTLKAVFIFLDFPIMEGRCFHKSSGPDSSK
ncbi:hypothetical protein FIU45_09905, partial [Enterococcus faecium]